MDTGKGATGTHARKNRVLCALKCRHYIHTDAVQQQLREQDASEKILRANFILSSFNTGIFLSWLTKTWIDLLLQLWAVGIFHQTSLSTKPSNNLQWQNITCLHKILVQYYHKVDHLCLTQHTLSGFPLELTNSPRV